MNRYALIDNATALVVNVIMLDDDTDWLPEEGFSAMASEEASAGWLLVGGELQAPAPEPIPPPTQEEIAAGAAYKKANALVIAALAIAPLQDAVDLGEETAEEAALLKAWKQYRVAVNRVPSQPEFPGVIAWPVPPVPLETTSSIGGQEEPLTD